jgi:hypothetical protein
MADYDIKMMSRIRQAIKQKIAEDRKKGIESKGYFGKNNYGTKKKDQKNKDTGNNRKRIGGISKNEG